MASLRETKDRIASVRGTLKITSAMKLVSSAKLRKAQRAIENLRPYERELSRVLAQLSSGTGSIKTPVAQEGESAAPGKTIIIGISSNTSLCGGFNSNAIRKVQETIASCDGPVEVHSLGRKMADAMKKVGFVSPRDYTELMAHTSYSAVAALAEELSEQYRAGEIARVLLVYNHFVTTAKQVAVVESYLPFSADFEADDVQDETDYILEPSAEEIVAELLPRVMTLKFYSAVLDSQAAEQAARTVAMQTATDNAEDLLSELTLEYNKGRQQKITAEILDLLGGASR